jgi:23S rRNA pseudouridine1911/1915/1917 synthase
MQINAPNDDSLINILACLSPESSKTTLRSWIKDGRVYIDDVPAKRADQPVAKDQIVSLGNKQRFADQNKKLKILYEDRHLVAIDKPEGLLSVATAFQKEETAHALVKAYYAPKKVYVIHRIDQDTSGVMLFGLSEEGYEGLKILFEKHDIERSYCAIVEGRLEQQSGTWSSYLYEDPAYRVHSTDDPEKGKMAITNYTVDDASPYYSRLTLKLETGRKNQIRVHCQDAGHSIVGDKKYGAVSDPIKRLCLHAASLGFIHPVTDKQMRFTSPLPEEFYRLVPRKPKRHDA